jgi:SulP family sulfate permease
MKRAWIQADVAAGLTVALVGLPQCIAYALMSGLPPAYGLSTAVVAGLVAALAGRSPQVVTGPTNTTGLLLLGTLLPYLGENGLLEPHGLPALATLTLLAGALRVGAALVGGAHLIRFLPESVLVGFTAGAGVLISVMQLDEALGLGGVRAASLAAELRAVAAGIGGAAAPAMAMTAGTIAAIALGRRWLGRWPLALIAVVGGTLLAWGFGWGQAQGLPLVGERAPVPSGWPPGAWPDLDPELLQRMLVPAAALVLLGTLELAVCARAGGARPDMAREIRAQGWANMAGAFASGFPASASLTRSALLGLGGARTRAAAATAAVATLPFLLLAGSFVGHIPQASLAGVLIVTAWRMLDRTSMRRLWRASKETRALLLVTFVSTLVLPVEWAILIGSGTGLVIHLARTSAPRLRLLRLEGERLVPIAPGEEPDEVVMEVSGNLHYAAVPPFQSAAEALIPDSARLVVVDLSHAYEIRFMAVRALEQLAEQLAAGGVRLWLSGVNRGVAGLIARSGSPLRYVPAEEEPGLSVRRCLAAARAAPANSPRGE